jgi:3-oxoacyl-[acyl-carrier-protein] synthase III
MKEFTINRHGRLVFPSNAWPRLDFSAFDTVDELGAAISRDFEAKAPTATQIVGRLESGEYASRYQLLRDLGLHAFWVNRFAITMYDKRPTRWRDVPRARDDVFLPLLTPWPGFERSAAAIQRGYRDLPPGRGAETEQKIFEIIFAVFTHLRHDAAALPAIKPTVAEFLACPQNLTFVVSGYEPDWPLYSRDEILDATAAVPELEALLRWAMVLHNQYPWAGSGTRLVAADQIGPDDFVVLFHPHDEECRDFIRRARAGCPARPAPRPAPALAQPAAGYPPVRVRERFSVMPRLESLAGVTGEYVCSNEDIIRNTAWNWSPMTAAEITAKTGIEQRTYTSRALEELAAEAARAALRAAGRGPQEIGAVLCCTCTSEQLIPSIATRLTAELGMFQTHVSADLVAACAGLPYGLLEAIHVLQEVERPVLLVLAEKFSDKLGNVRTSRMLFGDGAAALVIGPATPGAGPDIEVVQTYAGGSACEVNAVRWPNPEFADYLTVSGPGVQAFVRRYLAQMVAELRQLPGPPGSARPLLDAIDLVVPHQANKVMVTGAAHDASIAADRLYFNLDRVGNTSAASIPLAIRDAVADGVIARPTRVFTPAFGAGATAGYAVMLIDPAIVSTGSTGGPFRLSAGQHAQACVEPDGLAVQVAIPDNLQHQRCELRRLAEPARPGHPLGQRVLGSRGHQAQHRGIEQAGGDRHHPDAVRREIPCGSEGKANHTRLRGRIGRLPDLALERGDRRRVDDDPTLAGAGRLVPGHRHRGQPQHVERAHQVDVDHPVEQAEVVRLGVPVDDPGAPADAGAVHHDPQWPQRNRLLHGRAHVGILCHVCGHESADAGPREFLARRPVGVHQHQRGPGRVQPLGGRPAQPRRGPGNQGHRTIDMHGSGRRHSRTYVPGAGSSGGYSRLPRLPGAFFSSPERGSCHSAQRGHHDPLCMAAVSSQRSGSAPAGGPSQ